MALRPSQESLKKWTKQEWQTKSGKNSTQGKGATGERYLPKSAIKSLSASEYAASTAAKRKAIKKGVQHSKQPQNVAEKTKAHRT